MRITEHRIEAACIAFYGEDLWEDMSHRDKEDARSDMHDALNAANNA